MISVREAVEATIAAAPRPGTERVRVAEAAGRVLREEIRAPHDSPPFDVSAMDGYAVLARDLERASEAAPVALPVAGEANAGGGATILEPGTALRINTGAPVPAGADAVVPVERVVARGDRVEFREPVAAGFAIRRAGEDYRAGRAMARPGRRLDPVGLGLLASMGLAEVEVARRPRVALLATGDELVEPGRPLGFGQIYNSTRPALAALLRAWGAEVADLGTASDEPGATRDALARGLEFDMLVTTGGVSMGSRDLVRPTLLELGAAEVFWKVAQRPGKPLFVARRATDGRETLCMGLPGNPVSVVATAILYARAALLAMQGADFRAIPATRAIARADFRGAPGLTVFARAIREADGGLVPASGQGSHQFAALAESDALAIVPPDRETVRAGEEIDAIDLREVGSR